MQELIENLDGEMKSRGMLPNWDMYLEKEKENIVTAWNDGKVSMMSGEQYFEETFDNIQNKIQLKSALLIAAEPLIKHLNDNHHPHTMVIVEHTMVQLYEAQQVDHTQEFLND